MSNSNIHPTEPATPRTDAAHATRCDKPETRIQLLRMHAEALEIELAARWQPIDTAPRDGTNILTWDGHSISIACWLDIMGDWWGDDDCALCSTPTHWMPLPQPPTEVAP